MNDRSVKVPHLVFAVLFLGTALVWLLVATGVLSALAVPYLVPGVLVAAGLLGLVAVVAGARRRDHDRHLGHGTVEDQPADDEPALRDRLDELDDLEPTAPLTRPLTTDPKDDR
ncbi:hypothetical protein [Nocardioides aequoreus]|uniref:hypothetical protein n=1 Tax=Nocardioides aequoreus TaxID=397278 RepID=UPI0004C47341|nr:hypothetical protein [Nocardioides aequoreus]